MSKKNGRKKHTWEQEKGKGPVKGDADKPGTKWRVRMYLETPDPIAPMALKELVAQLFEKSEGISAYRVTRIRNTEEVVKREQPEPAELDA